MKYGQTAVGIYSIQYSLCQHTLLLPDFINDLPLSLFHRSVSQGATYKLFSALRPDYLNAWKRLFTSRLLSHFHKSFARSTAQIMLDLCLFQFFLLNYEPKVRKFHIDISFKLRLGKFSGKQN